MDGSGSWEAGDGSLGSGKKAKAVAAKLARAASLGCCSEVGKAPVVVLLAWIQIASAVAVFIFSE